MIYLVAIISLLATTFGAISGIGGGVIIKPVMDATSGLPVATISFLSGCTVLAMSIVSIFRSRKDSIKLEARRGTSLAVGGAVGGIIGKQIFAMLLARPDANSAVVSLTQNVIMVLLTLGVFIYLLYQKRIKTLNIQNIILCFMVGGFLGICSSFLGIGGGPINLVVLYYFFSMSTKTAALHSLYIILLSQTASLGLTILSQKVPNVDSLTLIIMVLCGVIGGFLGREINKKLSSKQVGGLFQALLVLILLISCYNCITYMGML